MTANPIGITWAILPVKPFGEAKSRLQPVLGAEVRALIASRLLQRTLDVLREVSGVDRVVVVSRDPRALAGATTAGAIALTERGAGLNPAIRQASMLAQHEPARRVLIMACDLPLLAPEDVTRVLEAGDSGVVIAPDRLESGTNALLLTPPDAIETAFGLRSLRRHLELARAAGIEPRLVRSAGLGFDLDLPSDYEELLRMSPLQWDAEALVAG